MTKSGPRDDAKVAAIKLEWWPRSDWNKWPPSSESAEWTEDRHVVQAERYHAPQDRVGQATEIGGNSGRETDRDVHKRRKDI
jgi:hypothetical protein